MYLDNGEKIRFLVQSVQFEITDETKAPKITEDTSKKNTPPMTVTGRINGSGLGPLIWWKEKVSDDIIEEKLE